MLFNSPPLNVASPAPNSAPRFRAPVAHLLEHTDPDTGNVVGVVNVVSRQVRSLIMPAGYYNHKRASGAVGVFYEQFIAYILGGSRSSNASAQTPDVQLSTGNHAHDLLFEVKAGHRTNGIVLKRRQLETFSRLSNCSYAIVFHQSSDIQRRWESSPTARRTIRQELKDNYSSLYIVPPELLLEFYEQNHGREQPIPNTCSGETYISVKESHLARAFAEYK